MILIAHKINSIRELSELPSGYGVEIDIRAYGKRLILSHEPFEDGEPLEEYLKHYKHRFIIFNIKEAGIEKDVILLARRFRISNYFLLDVELPYVFKTTRLESFRNIAIRYSEIEPVELALASKGLLDWVWVDTMTKLPLTKESYAKLKEAGFKICLVCPERWGRPEDIPRYKGFFSQENIKIDAVMTSKKFIRLWE